MLWLQQRVNPVCRFCELRLWKGQRGASVSSVTSGASAGMTGVAGGSIDGGGSHCRDQGPQFLDSLLTHTGSWARAEEGRAQPACPWARLRGTSPAWRSQGHRTAPSSQRERSQGTGQKLHSLHHLLSCITDSLKQSQAQPGSRE